MFKNASDIPLAQFRKTDKRSVFGNEALQEWEFRNIVTMLKIEYTKT